VGKVSGPHRCRLMTASTSRKVAVCLRYQADTRERNTAIRVQRPPKECHEAVKAKEQRSRAPGGAIRPLALRLNAQMSTPLLKGHFQTPALHKVSDKLFCCLGGIGGKDSFGGTLARWITSENPADEERVKAIAIPQGCSRTDLQRPLSFTVPVQVGVVNNGRKTVRTSIMGSGRGMNVLLSEI
jgi:hypothetical protein